VPHPPQLPHNTLRMALLPDVPYGNGPGQSAIHRVTELPRALNLGNPEAEKGRGSLSWGSGLFRALKLSVVLADN
jgi:hypothetical protein